MKRGFIARGICCLLFAGCFLSGVACTNLSKEEETLAATNAVNYVKEKYGFTPDVEKVESQVFDGPIPGRSNIAEVTLSYKKKEFTVYIDCEKKTKHGNDNYQWDEFSNEIKSELEDRIECEDMEIGIALSYLDETIEDIDDLYAWDEGQIGVVIHSYGISDSSFYNLDPGFLGDRYRLELFDYIEDDNLEVDMEKPAFVLDEVEASKLNYYANIKADEDFRINLDHMVVGDMTISYKAGTTIEFTEIDCDYSFEKTANQQIEHPYSAYNIVSDDETNLYVILKRDDDSDDNGNRCAVDLYTWRGDSEPVRSYTHRIEQEEQQGNYGFNMILDGEKNIAFVKRSW